MWKQFNENPFPKREILGDPAGSRTEKQYRKGNECVFLLPQMQELCNPVQLLKLMPGPQLIALSLNASFQVGYLFLIQSGIDVARIS